MKKIITLAFAVLLLASCGNTEQQMRERAQILCQYIPDHQLFPKSETFMTPDFYQALSDAFEAEPDDPMDKEWLYYFVTGNGGSIPVYTIDSVRMADNSHAVAYVTVKQKWENGKIADEAPAQHQMEMEMVNGQWLMSDFDGKKQECLDWVAELKSTPSSALAAISHYLTNEIGTNYTQGQVCIPCGTIIAIDSSDLSDILVWGDFWVFNYDIAGDTLKMVSGGSHPGLMHVNKGERYEVKAFDQVEDGAGNIQSAKQIFGDHYKAFWNVNSNEQTRKAERKSATAQFVREHNIPVTCYQDHGWPAVKLP